MSTVMGADGTKSPTEPDNQGVALVLENVLERYRMSIRDNNEPTMKLQQVGGDLRERQVGLMIVFV